MLAWLKDKYDDCGPSDLSQAIYSDLSGLSRIPLTLTEMYWLNIPPVHKAPIYGGSNIWFVAGSGSQVSNGEPDLEPHVTVLPDGSIQSNVYMTVTMMITNRSSLAAQPRAWAPDRLNGLDYTPGGSADWNGNPPWTSVVFAVTAALQKPGYTSTFLPLQKYVFTPGSFGSADDDEHPFQTRIEVFDPYSPNTLGDYYGWPKYRYVYPVFYRWVIKPDPESRVSTVPLVPNWTHE